MNSRKDNFTGLPKHKEPAKPRHPSRKLTLAVAFAVTLIVICVAMGLIPRIRQYAELDAETLERSIPTVIVVSPKPGQTALGLPLAAEVKPLVETPIYARAKGYLKRRFVDIGDYVEAGQLLAEIDAPEINQELERARGQLAQMEASLWLARITAERWAVLVKSDGVSEQENAEKQADFKLKTASVASARAEVRRLEQIESYTRITAPFAGTITARNIDTGDLILEGAGKELFHLAQTRKLRVFVQVPQPMARGIQTGQVAEMTVPEIPGRVFKPRVIRDAGVIASDSRTLLVELELDNPKEDVLAGSYAQVRFIEAKMAAALTLPSNAILFRTEGPRVGLVLPDGSVELRTVKLGRDFGQEMEVLNGVSTKDRIIVNPWDSLTTGATVSVAKSVKEEKSK